MVLAYNFGAIWQSIEDTWLLVLIPIGLVAWVVVFAFIVKGKRRTS